MYCYDVLLSYFYIWWVFGFVYCILFSTYVLVHGIVALAFPFVFVVGLVCWVVFSCFGVEFWTNCFVWLCEFN